MATALDQLRQLRRDQARGRKRLLVRLPLEKFAPRERVVGGDRQRRYQPQRNHHRKTGSEAHGLKGSRSKPDPIARAQANCKGGGIAEILLNSKGSGFGGG